MLPLLVTGGCGFIGNNFIRYLLEADPAASVVNFDCLSYSGNLASVADFAENPRYRFVLGHIWDRNAVHALAGSGVSGILNFAAESHVDHSILDSRQFITTNVLGTQVLLDAVRKFSVPRYLQVSTDEVYGNLGPTGSFTEETPLAPNNPYAASKAAADLLVRSYVQTYGVPAIVARCSNNYGPYQFPEKLIPLFITHLLRNEPVPIYGDGLNVRDWIHVRDHCAALYRVWCAGRVGEIYNIGGRCERTNLEITHTLLDILEKPASLIEFVKDRPGHDRRYAVNCDKIDRELGWQPQIHFEEGLRETVRWYCEHPEWIDHIHTGEYRKFSQWQSSALSTLDLG